MGGATLRRFDPRSIVDLALWYRIGDKTTTSAGNMTAISELSGGIATAVNGTMPYSASDANLNGRPSVTGAATGVGLSGTVAIGGQGASRTVVFIGVPDATGGVFAQFGNAGVGIAAMFRVIGGNTYVYTDMAAVDDHLTTPANLVVAGAPVLIVSRLVPGALASVTVNQGAPLVVEGANIAADNNNHFEIGSRQNRSTQGWAGQWSEIMTYSRDISAQEEADLVGGYIKTGPMYGNIFG